MNQYTWSEIKEIPNKPGIYAWYYNPELTEFDIDKTIINLKESKGNINDSALYKIVKDFLEEYIFKYFLEDPYNVLLKGALKPEYNGQIEHVSNISDSLINRIINEPEKLRTIKNVIENSAPFFASPIYIGMSESLNRRLVKHKRLIEQYLDKKSKNINYFRDHILSDNSNKEYRDKGFAFQICKRNIVPTKLFVMVKIIDDSTESYLDIENILNRIHYPLLGRN